MSETIDGHVGSPPGGGRRDIEVLSPGQCRSRLDRAVVARVAVTVDAMPVILPVNVAVAILDAHIGPEIIIRTAEGSKLNAALGGAVVAIEVDEIDPSTSLGWSVLVRGHARVIDGSDQLEKAQGLGLRPWGSEAADRFVGVALDLVSGREIVVSPGPAESGD